MAIGPHRGKDLDEVPERDLRWILDRADLRPSCEEETELRESAGEVISGPSVRVGTAEWTGVRVGHYTFDVPPEVTAAFDRELARLMQRFPSPAQAFECMVALSSGTPMESLD